MRKNATKIIILAGMLVVASLTSADYETSDTAHVFARVQPSIAVSLVDASGAADLQIMTGDFSVVVDYHVQSNQHQVELACVASDLHKAWDANSQHKIPLKRSAGCRLYTPLANPMQGASSTAIFAETAEEMIDQYPAYATPFVRFQSAQAERFSMDVRIRLVYSQSLYTLPLGQYGGEIKLVAMVLP